MVEWASGNERREWIEVRHQRLKALNVKDHTGKEISFDLSCSIVTPLKVLFFVCVCAQLLENHNHNRSKKTQEQKSVSSLVFVAIDRPADTKDVQGR